MLPQSFAEQYNMCKEMVALLPAKIDKINNS